MSYSINKQRQQTMLERIGPAAALVDNMSYLPFFRSVQIKLEKLGKADEWGKMIEASQDKDHPSKYFANLCKRVRDGTYKFAEKVKEITNDMKLFLADKIVRFKFGKYQKYWVRKSDEFVKQNSMAAFIELLEFAERKGISQQYFAKALLNGKPPRQYYQENVIGGAKA